MSAAGQSVNVPSRVITPPTVVGGGTAAAESGMTYSGSLAKAPGRPVAPLIRVAKLIAVGGEPPAGVSNVCGIATSTLSPLVEKPESSGAPPLSKVATPADVTEYR